MKKLIVLILAVMLCAAVFGCASAEFTEMLEVDGDVFTLHVPSDCRLAFSPQTEGFHLGSFGVETADGITTVHYMLTEEARQTAQLFSIIVQMPGDIKTNYRIMLLSSDSEGVFSTMGFSMYQNDLFIDCSEGYEYGEGRTLFIRLPGSPYFGYQWDCHLDGSTPVTLADAYEIGTGSNADGEVTATASGFFFRPFNNPATNEGTLRFTLTRAPEGEPTGRCLEVSFRLDEQNNICDFSVTPISD